MCMAGGQQYHADVPLGLYVVRGDSIVLMGELNENVQTSTEITMEELEERLEQAEKEELEWDFDTDLVA